GFYRFVSQPIWGVGWLHNGIRSASCLNIYIQTVAETGLIGGITLLITLVATFNSWNAGYIRLKRLRMPTDVCFLSMALLAVELVHGLTESGPLLGTTMAAFAVGMGVGLADRSAGLVQTSQPSAPLANGQLSLPPVRRRPSAREVLEAMREA